MEDDPGGFTRWTFRSGGGRTIDGLLFAVPSGFLTSLDAKFYFITTKAMNQSFDKVHLLQPNHCLKIAYTSPTQAAVFLVATATSFNSFAHGEEDPFFSYYVHQPGQLHLVNHSPAGIRYS